MNVSSPQGNKDEMTKSKQRLQKRGRGQCREKIKYSLAMIKIKALRKMVTLSREN